MTLTTRPRPVLRRLFADRRAVALVEFAYVVPVFIVMSLTGAELTNFVTTRMRISQVALQIADNAARIGNGTQLQAKTVSEADINDLLTGAGLQAGELDLYGRGRVIVTSLEPAASPNTTAKYKIGWRRCRGSKVYTPLYTTGLASPTFSDGLGPTGRKVTAPDNGATMFVEVAYDYRPLIKTGLFGDNQIVEFASMMVRDRRDTSTAPTNTENATISSCS
ncbi:pilus assembly protein [Roseomonas aeriglobus]|nr:pilus assembly protein [Roseomonas aeriglobus]